MRLDSHRLTLLSELRNTLADRVKREVFRAMRDAIDLRRVREYLP